jgi:group I intron endonuclease
MQTIPIISDTLRILIPPVPLNEQFGHIYLVRNTSNGKVYIGQTKTTVAKRWNVHVTSAIKEKHGSPHLYAAIRKYGVSAFTVTELCQGRSKLELDGLEKMYISFHQSRDHAKGYNICKGGEGFTGKHTADTKRRITQAGMGRKLTDEHRATLLASRTGAKASEVTLQRLRESHKGKKTQPMPDSTRMAIRAYLVGHVVSEETRQKIRVANVGKKYSAEVNKSKGRIPWNKGTTPSQETKAKLRAANLGKMASEETKAKLRNRTPWNKGLKKGITPHE